MAESYYKIGDLAKLLDVGTDSIRYYEEVGIITPKRDEQNGYRLYTLNDIRTIAITREMLSLNFSTAEICDFISGRSIGSTIDLFESEINAIDKQIVSLLQQKMTIQGRLSDLKKYSKKDADMSIKVLECDDRPCIMISDKNIPDDYVSMSVLKYMKAHNQKINTIGGCDCYTLDIEGSNPASDYYRTRNVFFYSESQTYQSNYTLPAGTYLSLFYTGSLKKTKKYMHRLYKYAKENNYEPAGEPIEFGHIDYYETSNEDEFIIEIELPVRKRSI